MKFLVFTIGLLMAANANAQLDCEAYKIGKFVAKSSRLGDTYIKRTKKYQIEKVKNPTSGLVTKTKDKIVWLSDCTYKLIPVKIDDPTGVVGDEELIFEFVQTGEDYYVVSITGLGGEPVVVKVERD